MNDEEREIWAADLRIKILKQWTPDMDRRLLGLVVYHLMRILYFLRDTGEVEVADAIWQSIRTDNWDIQKMLEANHERGWFQSVADFPPTSEGFGLNSLPDTMFQLDSSRDGAYLQCWLVDCVMRDGWLAVGKFVRVSRDEDFELHKSWMPEEVEEVSQTLGCTTIQNVPNSADPTNSTLETPTMPPNETLAAPVSSLETITHPTAKASLSEIKKNIDTQLFKQLMQSTFLSLNDDIPPFHLQQAIPLPEDAYTDKEKQNFLGAALLYSRVETDWSLAGLAKLRDMRAVFDVGHLFPPQPNTSTSQASANPDQDTKTDTSETTSNKKIEEKEEPIYVLTPWNQRTERLPHAEARAMSMSWIVVPTGEMPDGEQGIREVFGTRGLVRGMWKLLDQPVTEYRVA